MSMIVYVNNGLLSGTYFTDEVDFVGTFTKFTITCGGGIGGSKWRIITPDEITLNVLNNNKFIEVMGLDGSKTIINTNYIVDAKQIKVEYDNGWIQDNFSSDYVNIYSEF